MFNDEERQPSKLLVNFLPTSGSGGLLPNWIWGCSETSHSVTLGHINKALTHKSIKSTYQHVPMSRVTHLGGFQACIS